VSMVSPKDTAKIPVDSAVFIWQRSSPNVDRYALEIATDSLMTNKIFSDTSLVDTVKTGKGLVNKTTYWWHVKAHNRAGWGAFGAAYRFTISFPSTMALPKSFSFMVNGMSNSRSFISYALPAATRVSIRIFGIQGGLIASLGDLYQPAGYYHVPINRPAFANGYYLLDFRAGNYSVKKKLPLIK
jgi:hypothetical protein